MSRSFEGITCVNRRDLEIKLEDFSKLISDFFTVEEETSLNGSAKQIKSSTDKLIKLAKMVGNKDAKGPFRNLFVDSDL